jgi:hypothetical protein
MNRTLGLLLLLPLAACANVADDDMLDGVDLPSQGPMVALPPQAGQVVGIVEARDGAKVTQTIALAADPSTPGQNQLVVVTRPGAIAPRISSDAIAAEMAKSLPGVPMSVANTLNRNAFGPFGYALGRIGDQTCLYGWQSIGAPDAASVSIFSAPRRTLSLRLRLCRSRATPASLVTVMQGLAPAGGAGVLMASFYGGSNDALAAASGVGTMASAPVLGQPMMGQSIVGQPAMADISPTGFEDPARPHRVRMPAPAPAPIVAAPLAAPQAPPPAPPAATSQPAVSAAPVPLPQAPQAQMPAPQAAQQTAAPVATPLLPLPVSVPSPPAAPLPGVPAVPLPPP